MLQRKSLNRYGFLSLYIFYVGYLVSMMIYFFRLVEGPGSLLVYMCVHCTLYKNLLLVRNPFNIIANKIQFKKKTKKIYSRTAVRCNQISIFEHHTHFLYSLCLLVVI